MTKLALLLIVVLSQVPIARFDPSTDRYMMKEPILRLLPDCPEPEAIY